MAVSRDDPLPGWSTAPAWALLKSARAPAAARRRSRDQVGEAGQVASSQGQLLAAAQQHQVLAAAAALDLGDGVQVDDDRAVDAQEAPGGERALEVADLLAHLIHLPAGVQLDVVGRRLDPLDVLAAQKNDFALRPDHQP